MTSIALSHSVERGSRGCMQIVERAVAKTTETDFDLPKDVEKALYYVNNTILTAVERNQITAKIASNTLDVSLPELIAYVRSKAMKNKS